MGSYPRCAPRSGRCGWGQGVVCVRVCLAEASVGLIGGCVRSCRLGGARRHPPPRAHGGSCRWLGLLCRAKRLLTRRLGVCSQVAIRARRSGVLVRWRVGCVWCCRCVSVCVGLTHRCARRRKPAWWCSPPLPAPGSWGVVVGLALPRGAASDSAAWCARRWPLRVDALVRWCVGQCVVPPPECSCRQSVAPRGVGVRGSPPPPPCSRATLP
jgi:hypothetical protein